MTVVHCFGIHAETSVYLQHQPRRVETFGDLPLLSHRQVNPQQGCDPEQDKQLCIDGSDVIVPAPSTASRTAGSRRMRSGRTPSEDAMGALGSADGRLLSRWGENSLPGASMPRVHDALQMLPLLLTKAEIDTINKLFVKFLNEGKKPHIKWKHRYPLKECRRGEHSQDLMLYQWVWKWKHA